MFIPFNGYQNEPINIRSSAIIAVSPNSSSTPDDPQATLHISTGDATEEWVVRESVESVLSKLKGEL